MLNMRFRGDHNCFVILKYIDYQKEKADNKLMELLQVLHSQFE